jgi:hypothetical protein
MESAFRRALGDVQNKMLSIAYGLIKREKIMCRDTFVRWFTLMSSSKNLLGF